MSGTNATNTLNSIKKLQDKEQQLYSSLGVRENGEPLNSTEQEKILDEINSLSDLRINLISELKNQYNSLNVNVKETNNDIQDELDSIAIMEKQLNEKKEQLQKLKGIRNNKLRMVQINSYYAERAEYVSSIYYTIVLSLVALVVVLFAKRYVFFLPSVLFDGLASLVVIASLLYIGYKVLDLYSRDKMNFNAYDYSGLDPKVLRPTVYEYDMAQLGKVRDVIVGNEKSLTTKMSSYFDQSSHDETENFQVLFSNNGFLPNDPYEFSHYEMNLIH